MDSCTVLYSDGAYFLIDYKNNAVITNNVFKGSGYATGSSATFSHKVSPKNVTFSKNTIAFFNTMNGFAPGSIFATITDNYFAYQGVYMDGAIIHMMRIAQSGTIVSGNWMHDSEVKSIRCDRINTLTADWGENATIINNVAWRTGDTFIKGDHHNLSNNVVFDTSRPSLGLATYPYGRWVKPLENVNSVMRNNAVDELIKSGTLSLPKGASNNLELGYGWWDTVFMNARGLDFRPKPGSVLDVTLTLEHIPLE